MKLYIERREEISCNDLETEEEIIGDLGLEFHIDEPKNIFFEVVDRKSETLLEIIHAYVAQVLLIVTDCWKGYLRVEKSEIWMHESFNHSKHFVDLDAGCDSNNRG